MCRITNRIPAQSVVKARVDAGSDSRPRRPYMTHCKGEATQSRGGDGGQSFMPDLGFA
jgi:hypothetical protein